MKKRWALTVVLATAGLTFMFTRAAYKEAACDAREVYLNQKENNILLAQSNSELSDKNKELRDQIVNMEQSFRDAQNKDLSVLRMPLTQEQKAIMETFPTFGAGLSDNFSDDLLTAIAHYQLYKKWPETNEDIKELNRKLFEGGFEPPKTNSPLEQEDTLQKGTPFTPRGNYPKILQVNLPLKPQAGFQHRL